jgi:hypothetical protein
MVNASLLGRCYVKLAVGRVLLRGEHLLEFSTETVAHGLV